MARYTGPACRVCRRMGEKLFLKGERCSTPKCAVERKNTPPGEHPVRRRKVSERGLQLREKQKARNIYGVLERQFRRYYEEALRQPGITGEVLLQMLERRLDNVVFRLGLAESRRQGRQLVNHGHFLVNGHQVDIPSFQVKPGDTITWKEGKQKLFPYQAAAQNASGKVLPSWLSLDPQNLVGRVLTLPSRVEMEAKITEQAIVEYYSR